ncbi:MAG: OadG family protein, partial [Firmicutes bacterium]|nr:OadG family protein [Bacillota bacterium]
MENTLMSGFWLAMIDMSVVFLVLYVLALIIKAIKLTVSPFDRAGGPSDREPGRARGAGEGGVAVGGQPGAETGEGGTVVDGELAAVISSAVAAYLDRPESVLVAGAGSTEPGPGPWALAG